MQDAGFVREAFANIAHRYVLTNHVLSLGIDVLWRAKVARTVAPLKPQRILDLATGSGDLARALQQECPAARIVGADFSVPMMREAQARGFPQVIAADALALPFQDDCFDVVTVAFGLRNMASWPGALSEMRRVLRPGGSLIVLDFSVPSAPVVRQIYLIYLKHVMPRVAGMLTGRTAAYRYLCSSIERFPSGRAMEQLIASCGFEEVRTEPLSLGIASLYVARPCR